MVPARSATAAISSILRRIRHGIALTLVDAAERYGRPGDYVVGANSAGFERVAHAMAAQGVI